MAELHRHAAPLSVALTGFIPLREFSESRANIESRSLKELPLPTLRVCPSGHSVLLHHSARSLSRRHAHHPPFTNMCGSLAGDLLATLWRLSGDPVYPVWVPFGYTSSQPGISVSGMPLAPSPQQQQSEQVYVSDPAPTRVRHRCGI